MTKVLVALRSPEDFEAMRLGAKIARERGADLAVCQRRHDNDARSDLALQQRITAMLHVTLGMIADEIPVFVVGDARGDDLASVAANWAADVLVTDGNIEVIT